MSKKSRIVVPDCRNCVKLHTLERLLQHFEYLIENGRTHFAGRGWRDAVLSDMQQQIDDYKVRLGYEKS